MKTAVSSSGRMDFRQFQKRRPMKFALHVASLALSAAFFVFTQHGALAQTYPEGRPTFCREPLDKSSRIVGVNRW
jgi:hypothetical protein